MLVPFEELPRYRKLVTLVDGAFDPLHPGHLKYFHAARSFGQLVLVNICPDSATAQKHPILLPAHDRAELLNNLAIVAYVHVSERPTVEVLHQLQPRIYCKGDDWRDRLPPEQIATCSEHGITIAYTKTVQQSSTALLARFQPDVDAFEQLVLTQKPADTPWEPVTDYSFEARKKIEGKHQKLICEVFQAHRILDAGCGPKAILVRLLRQQCRANVFGFDNQLDDEAPGGGRVWIGSLLSDTHIADVLKYQPPHDLVICREVLEHLTIQQIRRAVTNLCRLSSKFCYVTTRFSQARHFLDFATSDDADPSHISIMPKDWLRHLFALEGFRRRADLEERMDWQNKGRVLVYERV